MISFEPLWETMKKRDISQFKLDSRDTGTTMGKRISALAEDEQCS